MERDEGRLWVKLISRQALRQYMEFRGETNRSLALKCGPGVGRSIIGHLRSGQRATCSQKTAQALERSLNAPPGSLFVPEVAIGSQATSRKAPAA